MTSWYRDPDEDAKYEREDALTPAQMMQELEDMMERPYGSHFYGSSRPKQSETKTPAEWHEEIYVWRCERCGKEGKDSGCDFCGAICRRVKR